MITTGDFRRHYVPTLQKEIRTNVTHTIKEGDWRPFFEKGSMSTEYVENSYEEATGPARQVEEGAPLPSIRPEEGFIKRKALTEYGARAEYTKRVRKLNKKKLIARIAKMLSMSPGQLISSIAVAYFEYGDTAVASVPKVNGKPMIDTACADGLAIWHTTHIHKSDVLNTYSNKSSALLSLTQDNLQDVVNAIMLWTNNVGELLDAEPEELIVPVGLQAKAYELLHSPGASETANRADNALRQHFGAMGFRVWKRLPNQSEWYVKTNLENDFEILFGWEPEQDDKYDPVTRIFTLTLDFAFAHGVGDPRKYYAVKTP